MTMLDFMFIYVFDKEKDIDAYKKYLTINESGLREHIITCYLEAGFLFNKFLDETKKGFNIEIYTMTNLSKREISLMGSFYRKTNYLNNYSNDNCYRDLIYFDSDHSFTPLLNFKLGRQLLIWLSEHNYTEAVIR